MCPLCRQCSVNALMSKNKKTTPIYEKREKRKMAYKPLKTEIMGQNSQSQPAIKSMRIQSMKPDAVCGKLSEGKSAQALPLWYKQSDNTLHVLHLHLMSVQTGRHANEMCM